MTDADREMVGTLVGEAVAKMGIALALAVLAVKRQPGFDVAAFELEIQGIVDDLASRGEDTMVAVLQTLLPPA